MESLVTRILQTFCPKLALHYRAYERLIKNKNSYLYSAGWMRSLEEGKPTNIDGEVLPWMNYAVIKFLEERLKNDFVLFEYGSGYSTHFYATKVKTVTSLEYDRKWFELVKKNMPENVELIFTENDVDGDYCRAIAA